MYYVYEHIRNDNNLPFYVGKGLRRRVHVKHGRNKWWEHIALKYGFHANILGEFVLEEDALKAEREAQIKYEQAGIRLCNIAICGERGSKGLKHSAVSKAKISRRSLQLWGNAGFRNKMIEGSKGMNNPLSDKTIYSFYHPVHGEVKSTSFNLRDKYNLSDSHLCQLIHGKRFSHNGWRLLENKDKGKPIHDNNIYTWKHLIHGTRKLRKIDLMNEFPDLLQPNLCKLIKGVQLSHKGWEVIGINLIDNRLKKHRSINNLIIKP